MFADREGPDQTPCSAALILAQVLQITIYTVLRRHSDKNNAAIKGTVIWISLVNDNHVDNNLMGILVYVYSSRLSQSI